MLLFRLPGLALCACVLSSAALAQTAPAPAAAGTEGADFAAASAIIDTSIPFAIGAREAQQELRSAFGWPTFQEGLVEGVYFRIDPDGYARFSPTPRLDTDVFEVVCRSGSTACMGRKEGMSVYLTATGQVEIKLADVAPGDTFFITDGLAETPVPERILMPLDPPLETLLAYGGELVVRRGADEQARISLKGFGPVVAYLRWVVARQDHAVLPRGWPVPGAAPLTQPEAAASPWPRNAGPVYAAAAAAPAVGVAPLPGGPAPAAPPVAYPATAPQPGYEMPAPQPYPAPVPATLPPPATANGPAPVAAGVQAGSMPPGFTIVEAEYRDLLFRIARLEAAVMPRAQDPGHAAPPPAVAEQPAQPDASGATVPPPPGGPVAMSDTDTLTYLVSQLGFDPLTAAAILDLRKGNRPAGDAAARYLDEVLVRPPPEQTDPAASGGVPPPELTGPQDFVPLSEYLRAVTAP
jgi:hypothetical protein